MIPDDPEGEIDLEALEALLSSGARKPGLIAITHAPTNSGPAIFKISVAFRNLPSGFISAQRLGYMKEH